MLSDALVSDDQAGEESHSPLSTEESDGGGEDMYSACQSEAQHQALYIPECVSPLPHHLFSVSRPWCLLSFVFCLFFVLTIFSYL